MIAWERLIELLEYNSDTGIFTWRISRGPRSAGSIAGNVEDDGYIVIRLDYKLYKAHRLAWFYCFKEWPTQDIDHIDRNRSNNSLDNLREVSRSINNTNSLARNTTKIKHVYKNGSGYMVRVQRNSINKYLGQFSTLEDAKVVAENYIKNENTINR